MIPSIAALKEQHGDNFFLIAGPCVVESEEVVKEITAEILRVTTKLEIPFILKGLLKKQTAQKLIILEE